MGSGIGRLDRKVQIQSYTVSVSGSGQRTQSWANLTDGEVWADIVPLSGPEFVAAAQVNAEVSVRIRIRYLSTVTAKMRLTYGGVTYDILRVAEVGRREYLDLFCKSQQLG